MKKYYVTLSYYGSLCVEVDASNEEEALNKARQISENMDGSDFLEQTMPYELNQVVVKL